MYYYDFNETDVEEQIIRNVLFIPHNDKGTCADTPFVHAAVVECATVGIIINPHDISGLTVDQLTTLVDACRTVRGAGRKWDTLFPNFPAGVRDGNQFEHFVQQIVHYVSCGTIVPAKDVETKPALPIDDMVRAGTVITVYTEKKDVEDIIVSKVQSTHALPLYDYFFMCSALGYVCNKGNTVDTVTSLTSRVENATRKDNITLFLYAVVSTMMDNGDADKGKKNVDDFIVRFLSTTVRADIAIRLLLAAYYRPLYDGYTVRKIGEVESIICDMHTATIRPRSHIAAVPRRVRRAIVSRLEYMHRFDQFPVDDFISDSQAWKKILSSIHAFELVCTEDGKKILDVLFGNTKNYMTFNRIVKEGLAADDNNVTARSRAMEIMRQYSPGLFIRNLIAFGARDPELTLFYLNKVVSESTMSTPTLIGAINAIRTSQRGDMVWTRDSRGNVIIRERKNILDKTTAKKFEQELSCAVTNNLRRVRNVTVGSPRNMVHSAVPLNTTTRSETKTDRDTPMPGTRVRLDDTGNSLRFFVHWYNTDRGKVDIDLGMIGFDENFSAVNAWSYDNVYSNSFSGSTHSLNNAVTFSGDYTNAPRPHGASEFYDVTMDNFASRYSNVRYIAMTLTSFSGHHFDEVDNYSGVMVRSDADAGDTFDARTVTTGFSINSDSTTVVPVVFDIATRDIIFIDGDTGRAGHFASVTDTHIQREVATIIADKVNTYKVSMGELVDWFILAGGRVDEEKDITMDDVSHLIS